MNKFVKETRPTKFGAIANEKIRYNELRVMSEDNEQLGIMSKRDAIDLARQKDLDVVLITDKSDPPVVKITNLNKYNYELKKREKEAAKNARANAIEIKEVKFRPGIGEHDLDIKIKQIAKFIEKGAKVKITIQLRGREMSKGADTKQHLETEFASRLDGFKYEQPLQQAGNRITGVIIKDV
jgi:translation initiation factor IF-3